MKIETVNRIIRRLEISLSMIDRESYIKRLESAKELLDKLLEDEHKHSIEILDAKQAWDSEKLFDEIHDPYEEVIG